MTDLKEAEALGERDWNQVSELLIKVIFYSAFTPYQTTPFTMKCQLWE